MQLCNKFSIILVSTAQPLLCFKNVFAVHGLRTPRESFFLKIPNFWAWTDKLGRKILWQLGYFRPNNQHPFWYSDSESLVHVFHLIQPLFLQKMSVYLHPKYLFGIEILIWATKN